MWSGDGAPYLIQSCGWILHCKELFIRWMCTAPEWMEDLDIGPTLPSVAFCAQKIRLELLIGRNYVGKGFWCGVRYQHIACVV